MLVPIPADIRSSILTLQEVGRLVRPDASEKSHYSSSVRFLCFMGDYSLSFVRLYNK